jgi:2-oxoglutarate dehydrogenase E2 component (dihydrolipoamide succinyltransferase)
MAIVEVKVPQLSESVAEATMLQWKKKVGEAIAIDEILIEIETDKVVLEVPAPSAGVLTELVGCRRRHRGVRPGDRPYRHRRQGGRRGACGAAAAPAAAAASRRLPRR